MATSRTYTVGSGPIGVSTTSQTGLLLGSTNSTTKVAIQALRVGVHSGSGASYPSNADAYWYLARPTNTPSGGTASTPTPHAGVSSPQAANSTWTIGSWTTAPTAPTDIAGGVLWSIPTALSAGANWGEWVTPQSEWEVGPSSYVAMWVTCSSAPTSVSFMCELIIAE